MYGQGESSGTDVTVEDVSVSRHSVLKLCLRMTGRPDVAEDLAQEAMFLAWRQESALREPAMRQQWMLGIARNLCLRWRRQQGREWARAVPHDARWSVEELPEEAADLEVELERSDLADLLDRALALLPSETRDVLVQSYIEELPHSEIGQRLRLSESAVKARLHRGRLALRQVITNELRDEAAAYGLGDPTTAEWQETRIWCPECGRARMVVRFIEPPDAIAFRCPACKPGLEAPAIEVRLANAYFERLVGGLHRPKIILNKVHSWSHEYFSRAIEEGGCPCTNCGLPVRIQVIPDEWAPPDALCKFRLYMECEACGEAVSASFGGQILVQPEVQCFWQEHPRIHMLPRWTVEAEGRSAVVTRYEALDSSASLTVVSDRESFRVLRVHGTESEC